MAAPVDPQFITLLDNKLSLKQLLEQIAVVIEAGLTTLKLSGSLQFNDLVSGSVVGGLRYNSETSAVEYTNDGTTWNPLSSDSFWWNASNAYTVGTVVLHSTGWYVCTANTSSAIPGQGAEWRLLTPGSTAFYVSNTAQLNSALATANASSIQIFMKGSFTGNVSATVTAPTVVMYSDESSTYSATTTLNTAQNGNIYWHANNTAVTGDITCNSGTLWIEHIRNPENAAVALGGTGTVKYQRIDGNFTGGTQETWCDYNAPDVYVPRDVSSLPEATSYIDSYKIYVQTAANGYGYMTLSTLGERIAEQAASYFKIDDTGTLADRPSSAAKGYVYYASDTGDLYIYEGTQWGPAIHIKGDAGVVGPAGYTFIPHISAAGVLSWTVSQPTTAPVPQIPPSTQVKGADGKSAFEIWKETEGSSTSTVDDFLDSMGYKSRRILFTQQDVSATHIVTFQTTYPLIAIMDDGGNQWMLDDLKVCYYPNSVTADLTEIYTAKGLVNAPAKIKGYGLGTQTYDLIATTALGHAKWETSAEVDPELAPSVLYTLTDTPTQGATYAYTNDGLTENAVLVTAYTPAIVNPPITGNWYGLFGGGGGAEGGTGDVEFVETAGLAPGSTPTVTDVDTAYFYGGTTKYLRDSTNDPAWSITADNEVYFRDAASDATGAFAWQSVNTDVVYTPVEEPVAGSTKCYSDTELSEDAEFVTAYSAVCAWSDGTTTVYTQQYDLSEGTHSYYSDSACSTVAGTVSGFVPKSTSLHRKYKLSVPEGFAGYYYEPPTEYSATATYNPPSDAQRYYKTVYHQGGTWIYIGTEASTGNAPPELPTTSNSWWRLMAKPGQDGSGTQIQISVHKLQLKRPVSAQNLHLQVMRSMTGRISDGALWLSTAVDTDARQRVFAWNKTTGQWDMMTAAGFGELYNNAPVCVDMYGLEGERHVFFRWGTATGMSSAEWRALIFPNASQVPEDATISNDGDMAFTAQDVTEYRYLTVSPRRYAIAVMDNNGVQYTIYSESVTHDLEHDSTTIDLAGVFADAGIEEDTPITGTWKLIANVSLDPNVISGDHEHINKSVLDMLKIDLQGNIQLDGCIIVPASSRGGGMYLLDPGIYDPNDTAMGQGDNYSASITRVDPGAYDYIRVRQQLEHENS